MVERAEAGTRMDRFLRDRFPGIPSRSVKHALESGAVRANGEKCGKGRAVREGEAVLVEALAESEDWLPVSCDIPGASVAHEDGEVIVLCKPHDVHTEPQRPNEDGTLAGFLRKRYPRVSSISPVPGLTLLARLDYATSGAGTGGPYPEGVRRPAARTGDGAPGEGLPVRRKGGRGFRHVDRLGDRLPGGARPFGCARTAGKRTPADGPSSSRSGRGARRRWSAPGSRRARGTRSGHTWPPPGIPSSATGDTGRCRMRVPGNPV